MTVPSATDIAGQRLRKIARDYEELGYEVNFHVPVSVGDNLTSVVDLVATNGRERVLVQVRSSVSRNGVDEELNRLAEYAGLQDNTRLELVVVGEQPERFEKRDELDREVRRQLLRTRVHKARQLLDVGHPDGALLMAWSGIEGALVLLEEEKEIERNTVRARADFTALYSLSLLSDWQYELLRQGYAARNQVAHGYAQSVDETLARRVIELAELLLRPNRPLVGEMVDRVRERYEDPTHSVPHSTSDGGYQYRPDDPHTARDVLEAEFPTADSRDIDEAVAILQGDSFDWVRKGDY